MRRLHFVSLIALFAVAAAPVFGSAPPSVSGVVRDSAGIPQIGAMVQLLRPDLTVITAVYTSSKGSYTFSNVRARAAMPSRPWARRSCPR